MEKLILVSNPIENNFVQISKVDGVSFIFCRGCKTFLGAKIIPKIDKDIDKNKDNKVKFVVFKKKIKIKNEKVLNIGLVGLRNDLLLEIETLLMNKVYNLSSSDDGQRSPLIKIELMKQTKESLCKFKISKKTSATADILFILHKVEGRVFLLGRNGFYNKLCEEVKDNIYFILVLKDTPARECGMKMAEELINKGDQKALSKYVRENRIVYLNDFSLEKDIIENKEYLTHILIDKYLVFPAKEPEEDGGELASFTPKPKESLFISKLFQEWREPGNTVKTKFKCWIL